MKLRQWQRAAFVGTVNNLYIHRLLDNCLVEAVTCLKKADLRPVLLKGQAYARQYPENPISMASSLSTFFHKSKVEPDGKIVTLREGVPIPQTNR